MALQVKQEYVRFSKEFENISVEEFYGGVDISADERKLRTGSPTVFIGTPGRTLDLLDRRYVSFRHVKHFVVDECDQCLSDNSMRYDIQRIFLQTPRDKQVMMFTATLNKETKDICLKFMDRPHEIYVGEESKLTLHGLTQMYLRVEESKKNVKLEDILDTHDFSQLVIFVKDQGRARWLCKYLKERGFPSIDIHGGMLTRERMERFKKFKSLEYRILVSTNLMARGIDIQDINIVINYDMPEDPETYLHRVGRAGRFETKGVAITFVSDKSDSAILNQVQSRFEVSIKDMDPTAELVL
jgi:ATP-dependent RNA helicase UAP56/SUB2